MIESIFIIHFSGLEHEFKELDSVNYDNYISELKEKKQTIFYNRINN